MTTTPRCPTCRAELENREADAFPFCSRRCKLADLGSWLDGRYAVHESASPAEQLPEDSEVLALAAELAARRLRS